MLYVPCRFCDGLGCLVCDAERLKRIEEFEQAERRAVRSLLSSPRFQVLSASIRREDGYSLLPPISQRRREENKPAAADMFDFIEMEGHRRDDVKDIENDHQIEASYRLRKRRKPKATTSKEIVQS